MRSSGGSRDLLEEAHVRVIQQADVRDAVARERDAGRSHAEGPARVPLGIETRGLEHLWMHHARAEDLDPARVLAHRAAGAVADAALDVHFGRGLREREEARTEARL